MKMRSNNDSRHAYVSLGLALAVVLTYYGSASAQVAPGNPVSAYLFDEGTGMTAGDSVGSNDGDFRTNGVNFPTWNTNAGGGETRFDYAGNSSAVISQINDVDDNWITLGNPANLNFVADDGSGGGDTFTISAWVSSVGGGSFVSKAGGDGSLRQYQLYSFSGSGGTTGSETHAVVGGKNTSVPAPSEPVGLRTISDSVGFFTYAWQHVALVVESPIALVVESPTVAKYYVNGALAIEFDPGEVTQPTAEVLIGARHDANPPVVDVVGFIFQGLIDEVSFWDSALTQDNIDWLQDNSLSTLLAAGPDGDFDGDTDVDGADFLDWQRNLGDATSLGQWETNFGTTAAVSAVASIPEPASLLLMGLGALSMTLRSVRRRR